MKWAAVVTGLRQKGFSDKVIAEYSQTTEEDIGLMAKGRMDPSAITGTKLRTMEFKTRRIERKTPPKPSYITGGIASPTATDKPIRGVVEDPNPPKGMRFFKLIASEPGKTGFVCFPAEWVNAAFMENLWRRLDAVDPVKESIRVI